MSLSNRHWIGQSDFYIIHPLTGQPTILLYQSLLLFKATFFWQRRKWPIFLSDIDKFKVSTSKETCVGTCHFINNMSPTIFFLKTSKNNALWFSFQPSNYSYCEITHRFFFFEKKGTQFSNIYKFKTYYYWSCTWIKTIKETNSLYIRVRSKMVQLSWKEIHYKHLICFQWKSLPIRPQTSFVI